MKKSLFALYVGASIFVFSSCNTNSCNKVDCQNGGTCVEGSCQCPEGFSGASCEHQITCGLQSISYDNTITTFHYNAAGKVEKSTYSDSAALSQGTYTFERRYVYANGNPQATEEMVYDKNQQLTARYEYAYQNGYIVNIKEFSPTNVLTSEEEYTRNGQRISDFKVYSFPNGVKTLDMKSKTIDYDANNNLKNLTQIAPDSSLIFSYTYKYGTKKNWNLAMYNKGMPRLTTFNYQEELSTNNILESTITIETLGISSASAYTTYLNTIFNLLDYPTSTQCQTTSSSGVSTINVTYTSFCD
ncbi:MAG: calcium-binding EGF-like domain-containing protein [Bacteroidia bacterium]